MLFFSDQVTGENIGNNATGYWARLVQPCVDTGTHWTAVFGNHGKVINVDPSITGSLN